MDGSEAMESCFGGPGVCRVQGSSNWCYPGFPGAGSLVAYGMVFWSPWQRKHSGSITLGAQTQEGTNRADASPYLLARSQVRFKLLKVGGIWRAWVKGLGNSEGWEALREHLVAKCNGGIWLISVVSILYLLNFCLKQWPAVYTAMYIGDWFIRPPF